jgi:CheY-like chemotaxis protein
MVAATAAAEILDALRGYFWILLAAAVVWRLFPVIRQRLESGDVTFEIVGQKMSFSDASRQLHAELDDLRGKVIELTDRVEAPKDEGEVEAAAGAQPAPARPARILWVDDRPENNAFLIKSLKDRDADVIEAASTDEALAELASNPRGFDVVISDMGRKERGGHRPLAGVDLIRRLRDENLTVPVVIYASPGAIERGGVAALEAGAVAATASPTELLTLLRIGPTTAFEASVADIVRRHLDATVFPIYRSVDFVAQRDGDRIGIEIKNWSRQPTREEFEHALQRVRAARERYGFDRILMITRPGIEVPAGVDMPDWITVLTVDELVASLTA